LFVKEVRFDVAGNCLKLEQVRMETWKIMLLVEVGGGVVATVVPGITHISLSFSAVGWNVN